MQDITGQLNALNAAPAAHPSLDQLVEEVNHWRRNKAKPSTPIPDALWQKIFALAQTHSGTKIRALLGISSAQYRNKYEKFYGVQSASKQPSAPDPQEAEKLCQINTASSVLQPEPIHAINTIVVECRRQDGQILKIHTTNESIEAVLKAFYQGHYHASDNA